MSASLYIVDYGSDDLRAVKEAFAHVGAASEIGSEPHRLRSAAGLVLAGEGVFGPAMGELERRGLAEAIQDRVQQGVPLLGVGLGLQLLFEGSEESPGAAGLGLLRGDVRFLPPVVEAPHVGWGRIEIAKDSDLLQDVPSGSAFYFVHSCVGMPRQPQDVLTFTEYGVGFVSGVERDNVAAFQFHPERSGTLGLKIYRNFARCVGLEGERGS